MMLCGLYYMVLWSLFSYLLTQLLMYVSIYIYVCIYVCMYLCRPMNVCLGMYVCTMYIMLCAIDRALERKVMEDLTGPGRERVDRLPILVSGQNYSEVFVCSQTS